MRRTRCATPCTRGRRRYGGVVALDRRRSGGEELDGAVVVGRHPPGPPHPRALSVRSGRGARARPSRDRAVAVLGALVGAQDRRRRRRRHGGRRPRSSSAPTPILPSEPDPARRADGRLLTPHTLDIEREIYEVRYELARDYAAVNRLNRDRRPVTVRVDRPDRLGHHVRGGARRAGANWASEDDDDVAAAGIRVLNMRMPLPFDAEHRSRLRQRAGRDPGHRGEAAASGATRDECAVRSIRPSPHHREARRRGRAARPRTRRARRRRHRAGPAAATRGTPRGSAGSRAADPRADPGHRGNSHALLLLGLPAQPVDRGT